MRERFFGADGDFSGTDSFDLPPPSATDPFGYEGRLQELASTIQTSQESVLANLEEIEELESELSDLDPDDEDDEDRIGEINQRLNELSNNNDQLVAEAEAYFDSHTFQLLRDVRDKTRVNANEYGTVKSQTGEGQILIVRDVRFNLNEYLPQSERVKMSFWRVYPRRM